MRILFLCYDNESFLTTFPLGIAYLASVCRNRRVEVSLYNQDVYHFSEDHLVDYLGRNHFDIVGIGTVGGYYPFRKLLAISRAIASIPNRDFVYVLGGHGPSPEPEYFLRKTGADVVVIGEAEVSFINLVEAISERKSFAGIRGIAYREGDRITVNEREAVIKDVDSIPLPAWDLFPMEYYTLMRSPGIKPTERSMMVMTGRGCPFKCNFCYRMDPGFRPRSAESVIEEMYILKKDYHVTFFEFLDDLLMSSESRAIAFAEKIIASGLNIRFYCQGRLNFASREVVRALKAAGCVFINYGIEAVDDRVLENMNKKLTVSQCIAGIENTIAEGVHPGLNIIWGNIGDTAETIRKGVDFIKKYSTGAQLRTIRPVTPYPGSPLYYYAIETGLLEGVADFYEKKHINSDLISVNFTRHALDQCYELLFEANQELIFHFTDMQKRSYLDQLERLYRKRDTDFRGFRQT